MPVPPPDRGPFLSALGWVDDLSQIPLNVLRGRPGAAARKTANSLGDLIDATLPYDLIPEFGEDDERVRASELFDIDPEVNPGIARATDIVGGAVTNPLSYFGYRGGSIRAGLPGADGVKVAGSDAITGGVRKLADKAAEYIPEPIKKSGRTVRRALNLMDVPDDVQQMVARSRGVSQLRGQLSEKELLRGYDGYSDHELDAIGQLSSGVNKNKTTDRSKWTPLVDEAAFIADNGLDPARIANARQIRQGLMDKFAEDKGVGLQKAGQGGYFARHLSGEYFEDTSIPEFITKNSANSAPLRARHKEMQTKEQLVDLLRNNDDVEMDFNALNVDARRSADQSRMVGRVALGNDLLPKRRDALTKEIAQANDPALLNSLRAELAATNDPAKIERLTNQINRGAGLQQELNKLAGDFTLNKPEHRQAALAAIKEIGETSPDGAYVLANLFNGIPPRGDGALSQALHWGNQKFKSAATFGILLPRISFNVGNRASAVWQTLSEPGTAGTRMVAAKRALGDLLGAVDDGFIRLSGGTKGRWAPSELTQTIDQYEAALKAAKGDVAELRRIMSATPNGTHMLEAIDNGVMNGFVHSEMLLAKMARTPKEQRVADFMEWPAEIAKGVEQRMRLGTFLDLRKNNIDAPSAGLTTKRTYLDYDIPGKENRMFRDIVPFGAFLSQNIKQQAGLLARRPVVATVAAPFFANNEEDIKYPWMDNSLAVPTGEDETGNPQYITGFRTPIEGLTSVPGTDKDDLLRDTIGNMQPLLKTGLSYIFDRDSFTGGEFGEYDKVLGQSAGELGRAYNVVRGTGLLQPFTGPIDQLSNALDDRKTIAQRAIQGTTGVRFNSVDPDLAKRQRIEDYLGDNPDAKQYTGYYQEGENEGLSDLLSQLNEAKAKLKAKREAAKAAF